MTVKIKKTYPKWWNEACNELSKRDKVMKKLITNYAGSKVSTIKNPFYSLARCIVGQQISVQAADAVWNRLTNHFEIQNPGCFQKTNKLFLKSFGLSERKSSYLINLSNYMIDKNSYEFWNSINDEEINNKLLKLKGIGPWSIKMFLIFSLNRKDVFSPEDLGLLKAIGKNYYNGKKPDQKQAEELASKWSPWRTAACWFLWRSIDPSVVVY